nr:putative transposase En/Spm [Ipomoea batatas]
MSQRNARQKNKRLMSQPPLLTFEGNQPLSPTNDDPNTSPLASTLPQSSQNSDSERTVSASPNNAPSPPTSPRKRPTIHPIGNKSFEPCLANREVIECVTKIFPDAIKSYSDAPQHMKDVWFNEFKVRKQLAKGEGHPKWMSDPVLAQYLSIWNQENFKKLAEKNKKNRNSDCGGLGPSLHTAGSIPMTEHRRRLKEKLGEEPSHAALFQATHKRKKTDSFVCKKAQQVMDAATQIQQTQPELGDSNVWYEAAGGLKKGGYVFGFGSDTPHYFPEVVSQRNSKSGQSSSHAACDKKLDELKDQVAWLVAEVAALRGSNQQCSQSTDRADSHESSGVGLDDLGLNDGTQSPTQAQ